MTPGRRRGRRIVAVVCALLGTCAVAHAQSAVDGFDPGANGNVYAVAVQADGKILVGGAFTTLGGGGTGTTRRSHLGRLNTDGSLDPGFDPGANSDVNALVVQPDGKILVGGAFTTLGGGGLGLTARRRIARLNANGSLDTSFDPGANDHVYAMAVQSDGKILVGGLFSTLGGGGTGLTTRNRIGRLNADGSLDASFNPGANDFVYAFAVQRDRKILVGGAFTTLGGGGLGTTTRNRIGRLNVDGSLDASFNPGANAWVLAVVVQRDGRILVGGNFTMLGGGGTGTTARFFLGRLGPDGSLDPDFNPGANSFVVTATVQADGKILVGGGFTMLGGGGTGTTPRNYLGRLNANGSLDTSFGPSAGDLVYAVPVQPDGKILIGGNFTTLTGGGMGATTRNHIARLYVDGSLDTDFNPGANDDVQNVAVQPDGKILVVGDFTMLGGGGTGTTPHNRIGRLNADGSLDAGFDNGADDTLFAVTVQADGKILSGGVFTTLSIGGGLLTRNRIGRLNADSSFDFGFDPGANGPVYTLAVQPDGMILVGGFFTMLGGGGMGLNARNYLGRLNANGLLDASFNPGADGPVYTVAVQPDGKILVGGLFSTLGGGGTGTTARNRIGRLNADGSVDASFNPGANGSVFALAVQADGKILVGGDFTTLGGGGIGTTARFCIGRLNADGSVDMSFNPGANNVVWALAVQADGKILVGGVFTALSDVATGFNTRNFVGRFNADGSLDASFNPGASSIVRGLALQPDGKILISGDFTMLGGGGTGTTPRNYLGRLTNTGAATQSLSVTSGSVTWSRGGTGPEVWRVTFESSTDGATYTPLGSGTRVAGGWQLSGLSLPARQTLYIRARGFYATGLLAGSGSIVESIVLKTYQPFTDDVLTAGSSLIRVAHITELRARIDALRIRYGLSPFGWTDASLTAGMTVGVVHVTELRTALQQAYAAAGQSAPTFTDSPLVPGSASIKAVHIQQLRDAVIDLEGS